MQQQQWSATASGLQLSALIAMICYGSSFVLTIVSAVYLRHKIIHLKAYIRVQHQCNMDRENLSKSQRLKELLIEQVKPTIAVFVLGGVDAAFNLLFGIILLYTHAFTSPIGRYQIIQTVVVPLSILQFLGHSLSYGLYNKNI